MGPCPATSAIIQQSEAENDGNYFKMFTFHQRILPWSRWLFCYKKIQWPCISRWGQQTGTSRPFLNSDLHFAWDGELVSKCLDWWPSTCHIMSYIYLYIYMYLIILYVCMWLALKIHVYQSASRIIPILNKFLPLSCSNLYIWTYQPDTCGVMYFGQKRFCGVNCDSITISIDVHPPPREKLSERSQSGKTQKQTLSRLGVFKVLSLLAWQWMVLAQSARKAKHGWGNGIGKETGNGMQQDKHLTSLHCLYFFIFVFHGWPFSFVELLSSSPVRRPGRGCPFHMKSIVIGLWTASLQLLGSTGDFSDKSAAFRDLSTWPSAALRPWTSKKMNGYSHMSHISHIGHVGSCIVNGICLYNSQLH